MLSVQHLNCTEEHYSELNFNKTHAESLNNNTQTWSLYFSHTPTACWLGLPQLWTGCAVIVCHSVRRGFRSGCEAQKG